MNKQNESKQQPPAKGRRSRDRQRTWMPQTERNMLEKLTPYITDLVPESVACGICGFEYSEWLKSKARFIALRQEVKRLQSVKIAELQATVEAGAQGWQAAATLLERLVPEHYSRQSAVVSRTKSPLATAASDPQALKKIGAKRKLKVVTGGAEG